MLKRGNELSRIAELVGEADHVSITTLSDNAVNSSAERKKHVERLRGHFTAEHGLSFLVEVKQGGVDKTFLMDTGQGLTMQHNMEQMGIDAERIDCVVISHGHYDHTGGLIEFLGNVDVEVPVIAHPDAFKPSIWIRRRGAVRRPYLPVPVGKVEGVGGRLLRTRDPFPIFAGTLTTGEVARETPFEGLEGVFYLDDEGLVESPIMDDQSVVVNLKKRGLVIASGCGHAGIVNIVEQARRLTGVDRVCCVVGGFHLVGSSEDRMDRTIQYLKGLNADVVSPMHCSGFEFTVKAATELSDCFASNGIGTKISF
jgi:7,8-dihydropterin-6-yl-methyl-4-(beta-D-ribofuranosyl)aminobenzene 5'-phosphate synthase